MKDKIVKILTSFLILILLTTGVLLAFENLRTKLFGGISDAWNNIFKPEPTQITIHDDLRGTNNGGATKPEIEKFKTIAVDKPTYQDIIKDVVVEETNQHVVIGRKISNTDDYYNMSFVKVGDKLIWDGYFGLRVNVKVNSWWHGSHDWKSFEVKLFKNRSNLYSTFEEIPKETIFNPGIYGKTIAVENLISFSDFKIETFAKDFWDGASPIARTSHWKAEERKLQETVREYLSKNVVFKYFQNIHDDLKNISVETSTGYENINNSIFIRDYLNNMATYIFKNVKTTDKSSNSKLLNMDNYYSSFVPVEEQYKYPITEKDKPNFPKWENYPIFNNSTFFNISYYYSKYKTNRSDKTIKNNDVVKDAQTKIETPVIQEKKYTELSLTFKNKNNADLTNLNLKSNPVLIEIGEKILSIDNLSKLTSVQKVVLNSNEIYAYSIQSDNLIFLNNGGSVEIFNNPISLELAFEYYGGNVPALIKLVPISSLDISKIDIVKNPVTIAFVEKSNPSVSQTVLFNTIEKLQTGLNILLIKGNYKFTIVSSLLKFNEYIGDEEFDIKNRVHQFTFWLENEEPVQLIDFSPNYVGVSGSTLEYIKTPSIILKYYEVFNKLKSLGIELKSISVVLYDSLAQNVVSSVNNILHFEYSEKLVNFNDYYVQPGVSYLFKIILTDKNNNLYYSNFSEQITLNSNYTRPIIIDLLAL